jgi:hypothetical protein
MNYELGYGKGIQKIEIPDANLMGVLLPENAAAAFAVKRRVKWILTGAGIFILFC